MPSATFLHSLTRSPCSRAGLWAAPLLPTDRSRRRLCPPRNSPIERKGARGENSNDRSRCVNTNSAVGPMLTHPPPSVELLGNVPHELVPQAPIGRTPARTTGAAKHLFLETSQLLLASPQPLPPPHRAVRLTPSRAASATARCASVGRRRELRSSAPFAPAPPLLLLPLNPPLPESCGEAQKSEPVRNVHRTSCANSRNPLRPESPRPRHLSSKVELGRRTKCRFLRQRFAESAKQRAPWRSNRRLRSKARKPPRPRTRRTTCQCSLPHPAHGLRLAPTWTS